MSRYNPLDWMRQLRARIDRIEKDLGTLRNEVHLRADRIEHLISLVHSASSAASVRARLPTAPYKVLLLVHHVGAWSGMRAMVRAMNEAPDFTAIVASIPHRFPGESYDGGEQEVHDALSREGVEHLRLGFADSLRALPIIRAIDPDLILRQSQWDNDIPDAFRTHALSFARQGLVPYETMNLIVNPPVADRRNTAVDEELHNAAWIVFATNQMMFDLAASEGSRLGANVEVVGHAKRQELLDAAPVWPISGPHRRLRLLWAAHHSIGNDWAAFGTFPEIFNPMFEWATNNPDVEVVFLPHPELPPSFSAAHSPVRPEAYRDFLSSWSSLENAAVSESPDYLGLIAGSDVILTDGLSMLIEPQILQKPVVFLERQGHAPFNRIGEQAVTGTRRVGDVHEALKVAVALGRNRDRSLKQAQLTNTDLLFPAGDVGQDALEVLRRRFRAELHL
jgi:hypothetical protein